LKLGKQNEKELVRKDGLFLWGKVENWAGGVVNTGGFGCCRHPTTHDFEVNIFKTTFT